jgi:hypothetical protein
VGAVRRVHEAAAILLRSHCNNPNNGTMLLQANLEAPPPLHWHSPAVGGGQQEGSKGGLCDMHPRIPALQYHLPTYLCLSRPTYDTPTHIALSTSGWAAFV